MSARRALAGTLALGLVLLCTPAAAGTVSAERAAPRPPKVRARAYVVTDADTGAILAAKNAHQRLRPASTLKMLTALTLLPRIDPRSEYRARRADANVVGSKVGIVPGQRYRADDLFHGLFLASGNDAAHALATMAGGLGRTVRLMQRMADHLNARDTTVANPSGLDARDQYSSAYDLALIARAGLARADFRGYCSTVRAQFPGQGGKTYQIQNQNDLLYGYRGAVGVKTGYTTKAGHTFVGAAERGGRTLLVTLLDGPTDVSQATATLLDWGFATPKTVRPVGTLAESGPPPDAHRATPTPQPAAGAAAPRGDPLGLASGPLRWIWGLAIVIVAVAAA
ncbi:MAG: D-alanyl-D-alanine carboxypeptidase family protein, partial [Carbonactinosporaceae bacterium]